MAHFLITLLLPLLLPPYVHCLSPPPLLGRSTPRPGPNTPQAQRLTGPAQEFLDAHNQARAEVGVGPLRWSPMLANATARVVMYQRLKNNCQFADLSSGRTKFGANQLWARGSEVRPQAAVGEWVAEKKYYNYADNTCAPKQECGVYEQVVWRKSAEVGCAQASCAKDKSSLTVCFYNPPGNIVGERPY